MDPHKSKIVSGIIVSNVFAIVMVGLCKFLDDWLNHPGGVFDPGVLIFSNFFIVPFVMGLICAWHWRALNLRTAATIGWCLVSTLVAVLLSAVFLREGAICLLIVSPAILALMIVGVIVGRPIYRNNNNILKSSAFGILVVIFIVDVVSEHKSLELVSDTMIVNAPIEKVWPYVVEYEPIRMEETYWLFQLGMPSPVQSTVDGHEAGAGRKCIFSNGYVFEEKMTVYKPYQELTFDILSQPRDPEIMGHIDIVRGQFILKDNGDGTTTVIGNSWYKLYVFPAWYFNLWAESITRNVHLRVMEHIKILSEKDV
jgi:hypothetical protein